MVELAICATNVLLHASLEVRARCCSFSKRPAARFVVRCVYTWVALQIEFTFGIYLFNYFLFLHFMCLSFRYFYCTLCFLRLTSCHGSQVLVGKVCVATWYPQAALIGVSGIDVSALHSPRRAQQLCVGWREKVRNVYQVNWKFWLKKLVHENWDFICGTRGIPAAGACSGEEEDVPVVRWARPASKL